uniref:Uncharacterized protein n=1 Tax=Leersia perrieri TaxID=77586 RepID=A0A0D9WC47_9ORYZ
MAVTRHGRFRAYPFHPHPPGGAHASVTPTGGLDSTRARARRGLLFLLYRRRHRPQDFYRRNQSPDRPPPKSSGFASSKSSESLD